MIYLFLYYFVFASAVLVYGLGLNTVPLLCSSMRRIFLPLVKMAASVAAAAPLTWLVTAYILSPLSLLELYPLAALLILTAISVFMEALIRITAGRAAAEFGVSFLLTLLALNESASLADVVIITAVCFASIATALPLLHSLKYRIDMTSGVQCAERLHALILISIAVIVSALAAGNVSWLNPGALP